MEAAHTAPTYCCPVCGEMRQQEETCLGGRAYRAYFAGSRAILPPPDDVAAWNIVWRNWACNTCLQSGRAILAKASFQFSVDAFPPSQPVYVDVVRSCKTCGLDFHFTPREQQLWYEEWRIPLEAEPKSCLECRKTLRKSREVSMALQRLHHSAKQEGSLTAMRSLAEYYRVHGQTPQQGGLLGKKGKGGDGEQGSGVGGAVVAAGCELEAEVCRSGGIASRRLGGWTGRREGPCSASSGV
ncbi:MAG: zinc-ribbon domain containing protein [Bacteroidia bacterium]